MSFLTPDNPVIQALRAEIDQQGARIEAMRQDMDALAESCEEAFRIMAHGSAAGLRTVDTRLTHMEVYLGLRAPAAGVASGGEQQGTSEGSPAEGAAPGARHEDPTGGG